MEAFTGEVRLVGFKFAPKGWAVCDGTELPVGQYGPLFRQLGTKFGGDGQRSFALPDLRSGQIALGTGAGPNLTPRGMGDKGGVTSVTLAETQSPPHTHLIMTAADPGDVSTPTATTYLARSNGGSAYGAVKNMKGLDPSIVSGVRGGDSKPHENRMPFQALYYCICLQGQRSASEAAE
jgi:microcystin-dependent protein